MSNFYRSELLYTYSWSIAGEDNIKLMGDPDSCLFNRLDGYEVLYMIRKLISIWGLTTSAEGQKIERMIYTAPLHLQTQESVMEWVRENWESY